jgi:hypothetical protein
METIEKVSDTEVLITITKTRKVSLSILKDTLAVKNDRLARLQDINGVGTDAQKTNTANMITKVQAAIDNTIARISESEKLGVITDEAKAAQEIKP